MDSHVQKLLSLPQRIIISATVNGRKVLHRHWLAALTVGLFSFSFFQSWLYDCFSSKRKKELLLLSLVMTDERAVVFLQFCGLQRSSAYFDMTWRWALVEDCSKMLKKCTNDLLKSVFHTWINTEQLHLHNNLEKSHIFMYFGGKTLIQVLVFSFVFSLLTAWSELFTVLQHGFVQKTWWKLVTFYVSLPRLFLGTGFKFFLSNC